MMVPQLHYRDATLTDLPEIVSIYNSTIPGRMVTADTEPVSVNSRLEWLLHHKPDKNPLWVVEENNTTVGWVSYKPFYGRPAYSATAELSIYLHESHRGRGLGRQVLQHALSKCVLLGYKTLLAYIFGHNLPSLHLFGLEGFTQWAHLPRIAELDGIERDLIILGKRVQP